MNANDLKQYIIENNKIPEILEGLNCTKIKEYPKEYRCSSIFSDNSSALSIKKDSAYVRSYTPEHEFKGDIFLLVMKIKDISFGKANRELHKILGLKYGGFNPEPIKKDILSVFKKAKSKTYNNSNEIKIYGNEIHEEYITIPYIEWVREGIMPYTQKEFEIGYSAKTNRIIIPHRYWCGEKDEYLGLIGRTLNPNYKILDIPKYFPLIAFTKSMNLYGLQENYRFIQEAGYVNVFEAEKSVLKRHSLLDKTGVALCCHEISDEQVKILIGLNVDIIIQMDSDIELNFVRGLCEKFYGIRNVYYVINKFNVLKEKESPADLPNKAYNFLWKNKIKYDKAEHDLYIKWRNDNEEN